MRTSFARKGSRIASRNVIDGLSNTLAIGERHVRPVLAGTTQPMEHYEQGDTAFLAGVQPRTIFAGTEGGLAEGPSDADRGQFGSSHSSVCQFVYLDGHVSPIADSIDKAELMAISTVAGNEAVARQN